MITGMLEAFSLMVLWICSLVAVVALAGIVVAVVPTGWVPLFLYSCLGLVCAWVLYRRTVIPESKPVSMVLIVQNGFTFLLALLCFVMGMMGWFGLDPVTSQIAGLPLAFFLILAIRRVVFPTGDQQTGVESTKGSRIFIGLGYLWMSLALVYFLVCMVDALKSNLFPGVSMLVSPLNPISWMVIFLWFLPAFFLRAVGRSLRKERPY